MNKTIGFGALLCAISFPALAQDAAWRVLDDALHESGADHRQFALAALATIGGEDARAVKAAVDALHDKDPVVRRSAALALGEMKASSADADLKQALDDSGEVAFAAAKALTEIGDPSGRDVLVEVLAGERKDTAPGMMTSAMRKGKEKMHHPGELVLMGAQDATGAMFGPASAAIPAVKDALDLKSKGAPGRAAAAAYVARDPEPYAVTLLEWALADDNQFVRLEAAKGLGQRGNAGSAAKLKPLLDDPHTLVRDFAAAAIIRIGDRGGADGQVAADQAAPVISSKHSKP